MGLNLKKPNILSSSSAEILDSFEKFNYLLESSWNDKLVSLAEGESLLNEVSNNDLIDFIPDSLKNRSLITYIDAPWGSGKTRFIEEYIKWNALKEKKSKKIKIIDSWEIYNGSNINDTLWQIFKSDITDKEIRKQLIEEKKLLISAKKSAVKTTLKSTVTRISFLADVAVQAMPVLNVAWKLVGKKAKEISHSASESIQNNNEYFKDIKEPLSNQEKKEILSEAIYKTLSKKNGDNGTDYLIVIDNIERLSKDNRLDVLNKILNWANIPGVTYVFLTNFDKIKFTKAFEEEFWNKISLQETFRLSNSWKDYIENYSYDFGRGTFKLGNYPLTTKFIIGLLPTFFTENSDNMDIREIKKLLDNWEGKNSITTEKGLISSFFKYLVNENLTGLDKYFIINRTISTLTSEKEYWDMWADEFESIFDDINDIVVSKIPLFNNKSLRIQSNFFSLKFVVNDHKEITIDENDLSLSPDEEKEFKLFNNFIDDEATSRFKLMLKSIMSSRKIMDPNGENYISILFNKTNYRDYFEFKYNDIKKLYLYNKIKE